ncbi:MAG: sulfotransferase [Saprospiraceae bacterium]|nr:sulfotransferase [Saprospiraceae bacterium]
MLDKYKRLFVRFLHHQRLFFHKEANNRILHNQLQIEIDKLYNLVHARSQPIFVLSTGRCGTKLLSDLVETDPRFIVTHQPSPELTHTAWYAHQHSDANSFHKITQIIDACRYEMIRDAWLLEKKYVETNNRITFFAPHLASLFPQSKFIHLQRDPYKFIASGYSRNWYAYEKLFDEGRITPTSQSQIPWDQYNQVQKIAWLWKETNQFIRSFTDSLPDHRHHYLDSKDLYSDVDKVNQLLTFIGIDTIPLSAIQKRIAKPVNAQPRSKKKKLTELQIDEINQIIK